MDAPAPARIDDAQTRRCIEVDAIRLGIEHRCLLLTHLLPVQQGIDVAAALQSSGADLQHYARVEAAVPCMAQGQWRVSTMVGFQPHGQIVSQTYDEVQADITRPTLQR